MLARTCCAYCSAVTFLSHSSCTASVAVKCSTLSCGPSADAVHCPTGSPGVHSAAADAVHPSFQESAGASKCQLVEQKRPKGSKAWPIGQINATHGKHDRTASRHCKKGRRESLSGARIDEMHIYVHPRARQLDLAQSWICMPSCLTHWLSQDCTGAE